MINMLTFTTRKIRDAYTRLYEILDKNLLFYVAMFDLLLVILFMIKSIIERGHAHS